MNRSTGRLYGSLKSGRGSRNCRRFHVEFTSPELVPVYASEAEKLMALIEQEQKFIDEHPNYAALCEEANKRGQAYIRRLDEINPIPPSLWERLSKDEQALIYRLTDSEDGSFTSFRDQSRAAGFGDFGPM